MQYTMSDEVRYIVICLNVIKFGRKLLAKQFKG